MEDEILIESTLLLVGIFAIFIGFLIIMVSAAMSLLHDSKSGQDYSRRTGSDSSQKGENYRETRDYSSSPFEKPPAGKAESKVKMGGVIMLGPIPIIFGSDKESAKTAAILAIILMLLSLLFLRGWLF
jgi:uncharacterized protein (TIGR00304 family)